MSKWLYICIFVYLGVGSLRLNCFHFSVKNWSPESRHLRSWTTGNILEAWWRLLLEKDKRSTSLPIVSFFHDRNASFFPKNNFSSWDQIGHYFVAKCVFLPRPKQPPLEVKFITLIPCQVSFFRGRNASFFRCTCKNRNHFFQVRKSVSKSNHRCNCSKDHKTSWNEKSKIQQKIFLKISKQSKSFMI